MTGETGYEQGAVMETFVICCVGFGISVMWVVRFIEKTDFINALLRIAAALEAMNQRKEGQ